MITGQPTIEIGGSKMQINHISGCTAFTMGRN